MEAHTGAFEENRPQAASANTGKEIVRICGLTKKYGKKAVLKGIDLSITRGEIMGFLGPNGAGKSTTMNIVTGYISATDGTVLIDGINLLEDAKAAKAKIGYLPEHPPLYTEMTVGEYLAFVSQLKKVKGDWEAQLNEIMEMVKIRHISDRLIKNLSKGYQQRVGIAQALIGNPDVLILDEPTVGLDPLQILEMRGLIRELGKDKTIILSTHILQEVRAVCDRVTIIHDGRLLVTDTLDGMLQKFGDIGKYYLKLCGDSEQARSVLASVEGLKTVTPVETTAARECAFMIEFEKGCDLRERIFREFAKRDLPMIEFRSMELNLEEIFVKITNQGGRKLVQNEVDNLVQRQASQASVDVRDEGGVAE